MFDSIHWHVYGFKGIVDEISGFGVIGKILENMDLTPEDVKTAAIIVYAVLILLAYLAGNISPSTILAKRQGLDIKKEGSGNAGTTNALRVMGKKAGVITLVIDILKGVLAVVIAQILAGEGCAMYCAVAVILGHVWPVVYKFKGGKGVATTFGALLAINPLMALWTLLVVAVVTYLSKRMSAGSIAGAVAFPVICLFNEPEFIVQGAVLAVIVLVKHRANIVRLLEGEEPKLGFLDKDKKKEEAAEAEETVAEPANVPDEQESAEQQTDEMPDAADEQEEQPVEASDEVQEVAAEADVPAEIVEDPIEAEAPAEAEVPAVEPTEEPAEAEVTAVEPEVSESEQVETEPKPEKYKRPQADKNTKKNGKKKKSYPNKKKNGGSNSKNSKKNNNHKGNGNKGKSKKKSSKKK